MVKEKPDLSFWQIWNMCFGFLGIQFGFALQNANVSRIFQTLGAEMDTIPLLWIAGPVTGLIVQPIVGHFSDKTWTRLGRRRPYFLYGALATSLALVVMPNASVLWMAAGMLWIMDAAINVSMEPFRAFVGDNLPKRQQAKGYAMQSFFIGIGAVVASMLPWILAQFGVSNQAPEGTIPDTVRYAFYAGAVVLFAAVAWTVFRSREYSPEQLAEFEAAEPASERHHSERREAAAYRRSALAWLSPGLLATFAIWLWDWHPQLYILSVALMVFGLLQLWVAQNRARGGADNGMATVMDDLFSMPTAMKQLAVVQFFSWFALFAMWIYTTAAVTGVHFGSSDPSSAAYNEGANWVGVLFAAYNGFSALAAVVIPVMVRHFGLRRAHLLNLLLGAAGLASFLVVSDPTLLLVAMVGVGFAWASILSLPYAMLAGCLPAAKMGVYMGIFNFFIVIPQLLAASVLGLILRLGFDNQPIYALAIGAVSLVIAGVATLRVSQNGAALSQSPSVS
ncbi:MFS transporter [Ferrimonas balearica]|uniref:MFS transporter n=1 Tax=Ferrimonas balearica TaxID=44012 RepID=UPI001C59FBB4|nr:MFS transporter [Ferrimonas balearica]MBW3138235.1 MFS transporter [Ferrimonas balearica]MBW3164209.1 MFS transporter [Ferrimonas balearica]